MRVCDREWSEPLSAWLDGEAEPEERARVEAHLARCEACSAAVRAYRGLGVAMRARSTEPPPDLEARLRERLTAQRRKPAMRQRLRWAWVTAAGVAAVLLLALWQGPVLDGELDQELDEALAGELVSHHLRGFARPRPCEIESDDPAVVRGWVEERLGYRVEVPKAEGVELMGARACRIDGLETAALLYRYEDAPMTIFVPPPGSEVIASAERFASSGSRCTEGPIGERICVSLESQAAFAVSSLPEAQILSIVR